MRLPGYSGGVMARLYARIGSALATVMALALAMSFAPTISADENISENVFDSIIAAASQRNSVDPLLIKAVIWNESRFNPRATGASGEVGLMQLKTGAVRDWADETGRPMPARSQLYDPYLNIEIGSWFLARAMQRWDGKNQCYTLALCEYNAGHSRAERWLSRTARDSDIYIASAKTRRYVVNVRDKYIQYSAENAASLAKNLPSETAKAQLNRINQ